MRKCVDQVTSSLIRDLVPLARLVLFGLAGSLFSCGGRSGITWAGEDAEGQPLGDGDGGPSSLLSCDNVGDCASGEACLGGICQQEECTDGQERCQENREEYCHPEQGWSVWRECPAGTTCQLAGATTFCSDGLDLVCPPGISWCDSEDELFLCNAEGTAFTSLYCAGFGARCQDSACVPLSCSPGERYCADNNVLLCENDGLSSALIESCGSTSACVFEPSVRCEEIVCSPGSLVCQANVQLTCNETGTGFSSAIDCGQGLCIDGDCRPILCSRGEFSCLDGNVVQCSENGTEWALSAACDADQNCLEGVATCQEQVCVPDALFCLNNTTAECNSDGSGYIEGMDCGMLTCIGGTCRSESLFFEDFEDQMLDGWSDLGFDYEYSIASGTAASGSYSLTLSGGHNGHYDGVFYQLPAGQSPQRVTYWARQDSPGAGTYFSLHDALGFPTIEEEIVFIYFRADGYLSVGTPVGSLAARPWQIGVWYEIAIDLDWPNRAFDVSVDGVLYLEGNKFRGLSEANEVKRISLYHYDDVVGYWDNIDFE